MNKCLIWNMCSDGLADIFVVLFVLSTVERLMGGSISVLIKIGHMLSVFVLIHSMQSDHTQTHGCRIRIDILKRNISYHPRLCQVSQCYLCSSRCSDFHACLKEEFYHNRDKVTIAVPKKSPTKQLLNASNSLLSKTISIPLPLVFPAQDFKEICRFSAPMRLY